MYIDNSLVVTGAFTALNAVTFQAPTTTGSTLSINSIDLGVARDTGEGADVFMRILVGTAFTATAAATVEFQAITASDPGLLANVTVIGSTGPQSVSNTTSVAATALIPGATYKVAVIGTTDFTLVGGANVVGNIFTATGTTAGTGTATLSGLTAGSRLVASVNASIGSKGQRYLGARFVVTGTLLGTSSAFIDFGTDIQDGQKFYPGGFALL